MILLFFAKQNIASSNLFDSFNNLYDFNLIQSLDGESELYDCGNFHAVNFNSNMVEWDHLKDKLDLEKYSLIIAASSHKAESGTKSLTLHFTGNFGVAKGGGENQTLSYAPSYLCSRGLQLLDKHNNNLGFEISLETSHHGPTQINTPIVFIEVGSSEAEWNDSKAITTLTNAIDELIKEVDQLKSSQIKSYIGFGGTHYAAEFTKLALMGINFGHMCPKHYVNSLTNDLLDQMVNKTIPKPNTIVVDWKSLNKEARDTFIPYFEEKGFEIIRSEKLKKELRN